MKPRVVILSAFLTPLRSGAEACAEEVALRLCNQYDITIVTARMRRSLPKRDMLQGKVPVIRVGFGFGFDKWLYPFLAPLTARKLKPDLTHAVLETFAGLALMFCSGKKLLTLQTTNRSFLKNTIIRAADRVTAISSVLAKQAKEAGRDAEIIPNGIDLTGLTSARAKYPKVSQRILFVGRLEPMKGIDTLLTAFSILRKKYPSIELHIAGGGSLFTGQLLQKYPPLVAKDGVTKLGSVTGETLFEEYAQASIFCALSRSEALGNVFIEAQAAGCAVVATNVGGIPEIVLDGKTGILVPSNDAKVAAAAMERLLTDSKLSERLSRAAIEHTKKFDWDLIVPRYAAVYASFPHSLSDSAPSRL